MRKLFLLSLVSILVISLAAPAGAAFAIEEVPPEASSESDDGVALSGESIDQVSNEVLDENMEAEVTPTIAATVPQLAKTESNPRTTETISESLDQVVDVVSPDDTGDDDLAPTGNVLVTALQLQRGWLKRVELTNTTSKPVSVQGWKIVMMQFNDVDELICEIPLGGYILAHRSVTFAINGNEGEYMFTPCTGELEGAEVRVLIEKSGVVFERIKVPNTERIYERRGITATYKKGMFDNDFKAVDTYRFVTSMLYDPPKETPLKIIELLPNPLPCSSVIDPPPTCFDYVKIYNETDSSVDLSRYKLRVGQITSSPTTNNTYQLYGVVASKSYILLQVTIDENMMTLPNGGGTAWLQDEFGVVDYPSNVAPYEGADRAANTGRSWAYNSGTGQWQWATPAPWTLENDFTEREHGKGGGAVQKELKPCRPDQYRSLETNRCRKQVTAGTLKPCREGQYRSEETNRCRSIALAVAALKPCRDDQFRNPATNRCRKIASADDIALADCGEGRERNPLTNRCRNIRAVAPPATDFAIEPIIEPASVFIGWWVMGGMALAAIGYGGWEWRVEIIQAVRKVMYAARSRK